MLVENKLAENVFGTAGTICWTVQLIPQVWKSYRDKSTEGFSPWFMLLWGISGSFSGQYALLQRLNIPLIVQANLFAFLSFVCWGQCQYYSSQPQSNPQPHPNPDPQPQPNPQPHPDPRRRTRLTASLLTLTLIATFGTLEALLVLLLRAPHDAGHIAPASALGIVAAVLIALALFPQYWEIYKRREVRGVSMVFIGVDILGGVFNDLSLGFRREWDWVAGGTYTVAVVLDMVIVIAALVLNPRARRRRELERLASEAESSPPEPEPETVQLENSQ